MKYIVGFIILFSFSVAHAQRGISIRQLGGLTDSLELKLSKKDSAEIAIYAPGNSGLITNTVSGSDTGITLDGQNAGVFIRGGQKGIKLVSNAPGYFDFLSSYFAARSLNNANIKGSFSLSADGPVISGEAGGVKIQGSARGVTIEGQGGDVSISGIKTVINGEVRALFNEGVPAIGATVSFGSDSNLTWSPPVHVIFDTVSITGTPGENEQVYVSHDLSELPANVQVTPANSVAAGCSWFITNVDNYGFYIKTKDINDGETAVFYYTIVSK